MSTKVEIEEAVELLVDGSADFYERVVLPEGKKSHQLGELILTHVAAQDARIAELVNASDRYRGVIGILESEVETLADEKATWRSDWAKEFEKRGSEVAQVEREKGALFEELHALRSRIDSARKLWIHWSSKGHVISTSTTDDYSVPSAKEGEKVEQVFCVPVINEDA